jgi:hypothetical protein
MSILKVSGPTVELSPEDAKCREALERMVGERPKLFYMEAKPDEQAEISSKVNYKILAGIASGKVDAMATIKSKAAEAKFPMLKLMRYMKTMDRTGDLAKNMAVEY